MNEDKSELQDKLNALATQESQPAVEQTEKKSRGRPKGWRKYTTSPVTTESTPKPVEEKPVPAPEENKAFSMAIMMAVNSLLKPKFDSLKLTLDEADRLSVPYYQLYRFYTAEQTGIGMVWANAIFQTAVIFIAKYQIAKEIMKNEEQPKEGSEGQPDIRPAGNGKINIVPPPNQPV